jgi:hypothetical protein
VVVYLIVGWIGALAFPSIVANAGLGAGALIAAGGVLYTIGAVIYALQRPDPRPSVFGYHEIFHVLVVAAAIAHFTAVAIYAGPARCAAPPPPTPTRSSRSAATRSGPRPASSPPPSSTTRSPPRSARAGAPIAA